VSAVLEVEETLAAAALAASRAIVAGGLDEVEVAGEDRSKRGKRGGRKRLLELEDGSHLTLPANAPVPEGARDLLVPLGELGSPDVSVLRERVLQQLSGGAYAL